MKSLLQLISVLASFLFICTYSHAQQSKNPYQMSIPENSPIPSEYTIPNLGTERLSTYGQQSGSLLDMDLGVLAQAQLVEISFLVIGVVGLAVATIEVISIVKNILSIRSGRGNEGWALAGIVIGGLGLLFNVLAYYNMGSAGAVGMILNSASMAINLTAFTTGIIARITRSRYMQRKRVSITPWFSRGQQGEFQGGLMFGHAL